MKFGTSSSHALAGMAKGRKLAGSRSERLLGSYGYGYDQGGAGEDADAPDLNEEDVWSMVEDERVDREIGYAGNTWSPRAAAVDSNGGGTQWTIPPRGGGGSRQAGGLSLAFDERATASPRVVHQFHAMAAPQQNGHHRHHHHHHVGMATSAPVNVPDWQKILRVDSVESMRDSMYEDGDAEDDDDNSEWVPPHEYLARSRRAAATSVFEGVGRTLKGRDLRRVRDAVWSQTGFDG